METSNSDAKHTVVHAQNDWSCLVPIENRYSGPKVAVLHAKTTVWVLDPQRLLNQVLKSRFCIHKNTGEGWNPYGLDILVLGTLLCVLITTDEVWDPYRLVLLVLKPLFCMHKTKDDSWNPYRLVIQVLIALFCRHKTTGEV